MTKRANFTYHDDNGFLIVEHTGGTPTVNDDRDSVIRTLIAGHALSNSDTRVIALHDPNPDNDDTGNIGYRVNIEEGGVITKIVPLGYGDKAAALTVAVELVKKGLF